VASGTELGHADHCSVAEPTGAAMSADSAGMNPSPGSLRAAVTWLRRRRAPARLREVDKGPFAGGTFWAASSTSMESR
jgi:hypothetical protein